MRESDPANQIVALPEDADQLGDRNPLQWCVRLSASCEKLRSGDEGVLLAHPGLLAARRERRAWRVPRLATRRNRKRERRSDHQFSELDKAWPASFAACK